MIQTYSSRDLTWKGEKLFVVGRRAPIAEVVCDERYPAMWRFRLLPDGKLSDMVNLPRAKDAAIVHAQYAPRSLAGAASIAPSDEAATTLPAEVQNAPASLLGRRTLPGTTHRRPSLGLGEPHEHRPGHG